MIFNKSKFYIGLGISSIFTASVTTGLVQEKRPPSITQCEQQAEKEEAAFRSRLGYDLSNSGRLEFMHIDVMRRYCIDQAKAGPRLSIAGL